MKRSLIIWMSAGVFVALAVYSVTTLGIEAWAQPVEMRKARVTEARNTIQHYNVPAAKVFGFNDGETFVTYMAYNKSGTHVDPAAAITLAQGYAKKKCGGSCGKGKVCNCKTEAGDTECSWKCRYPPIQTDGGDCDPLGGNC